MKAIIQFVLALASASTLSACVPAVKSYVDPQYHHATYDTVHRLAQPVPVKIEARFEVNGVPKPSADAFLKNQVGQVLRSSGVFIPSDFGNAASEISVVANNIADIGSARAKGFATGMTFGAAGSVIPDNYEFDIVYRENGATKYTGAYKHRLITTVGNATGPAFATPTTPDDGFHRIVEDTMLNFVQEMQDKEVMAK